MSAVPANQSGHFLAEFQRLGGRLSGGRAGAERRQAAIAVFDRLGFPTQRHEAWKYTNVSALARRAFRVAEGGDAVDAERIKALRRRHWACHELVFVNGHYRPDLSEVKALGPGVRIANLAAALTVESAWADASEAIRRAAAENPFVALNNAFMADGASIEVADGTEVEPPIHLLFLMAGGEPACFPRVRIEVGAGARVCVVETYRGVEGAAGLTDTLTEIVAAEGAAVSHCKVQEESERAFHVGNLFIDLGRGSRVSAQSVSLGALLARHDVQVRLDAEEAAVSLDGLYLADGRRHVDHHTRIDHLKPHTVSREFYKGVLSEAGRGVFNGKVVVHPGAVKTDAEQSNKNLLLSANAEVDTKPELEIYADDVKCAHGATVGQLDANALFYLRSRGLGEETARRLLVHAFAADVLARVPIEGLRADLAHKISGHLPGGLREEV